MKSERLSHYLQLRYPIELFPDEEGFVATHPDLPGCMSAGDTVDEALKGLEEAKELWIQGRLDAGEPIPDPKAVEEYSGKFVLRIPRSLHRALDHAARREGVSLNQYLVHLLSERQQISELKAQLKALWDRIKAQATIEPGYWGYLEHATAWTGVSAEETHAVRTGVFVGGRHHGGYMLIDPRMHEQQEGHAKHHHLLLDLLEFLPKPPAGKQVFKVGKKMQLRKDLVITR